MDDDDDDDDDDDGPIGPQYNSDVEQVSRHY